jgi:hypothetical protein
MVYWMLVQPNAVRSHPRQQADCLLHEMGSFGAVKRIGLANCYISYRRHGGPRPFISPNDGFGIALLDLPWIIAGTVARFISERTLISVAVLEASATTKTSSALHNVGFTAELGGVLELWPTDFLHRSAPWDQRRPGL